MTLFCLSSTQDVSRRFKVRVSRVSEYSRTSVDVSPRSQCAIRALFIAHYDAPRVIAVIKLKPRLMRKCILTSRYNFARQDLDATQRALGGRIKGVIKLVRLSVFRHRVYIPTHLPQMHRFEQQMHAPRRCARRRTRVTRISTGFGHA